MLPRSRRIFISHTSEDDRVATSLVEGLAPRGLQAFVNHHPRTGIIPGKTGSMAATFADRIPFSS